VAISVYEGNTADASTLMPQVTQLREQFGLERWCSSGIAA
jgi:hypothetical protein